MFIIGWIQWNYEKNLIQTNLKWNGLNFFELNQIQFNWNFNENIINHVESKGEEYCVQFISLQFRNLNSNQIQLNAFNSNCIKQFHSILNH